MRTHAPIGRKRESSQLAASSGRCAIVFLSNKKSDLPNLGKSDTLFLSSFGWHCNEQTPICFCHPPTVAGEENKRVPEHFMKTILVLLMLFSVVTLPALGELTDADLNQIRLIVNNEIAETSKAEKSPSRPTPKTASR